MEMIRKKGRLRNGSRSSYVLRSVVTWCCSQLRVAKSSKAPTDLCRVTGARDGDFH